MIRGLDGIWVMEKNLTTGIDSILKLQGIPWLTRKAIALGEIRLKISTYSTKDAGLADQVDIIDIFQSLTGSLAGTNEKRTLNWAVQNHVDHIFGSVQSWSRLVNGIVDGKGNISVGIEVQTKLINRQIEDFLRGETLQDGSRSPGFSAASDHKDCTAEYLVQTFASSIDHGWTAEQIWGFEVIDGKRYYTRRIVVATDQGEYRLGRIVYAFQNKH